MVRWVRSAFFCCLLAATSAALAGPGKPSSNAQNARGEGFRSPVAIPECDDGFDNNSNGLIDIVDPYCRISSDDDESGFGSGVAGDDMNSPSGLDCWFDLNSGSGDDGCDLHACCMIEGTCPAGLQPELFDSADCDPTQTCIDECQPLAKIDCDCFGCCDICEPGTTNCREVFVHPAISPSCTLDTLDDPGFCQPCVRNPACSGPAVHLFSDGFEADGTGRWSNSVPS